MKTIIKLDDEFNINFGYMIKENSKQGIVQACKEIMKSYRYKDKYDYYNGINWMKYVNNSLELRKQKYLYNDMIEDIKNNLSHIPYYIALQDVVLQENETNCLSLIITAYFLVDNSSKATLVSFETILN